MFSPTLVNSPAIEGLLALLADPAKARKQIDEMKEAAKVHQETEAKALAAQKEALVAQNRAGEQLVRAERAQLEVATLRERLEKDRRNHVERLEAQRRQFDSEAGGFELEMKAKRKEWDAECAKQQEALRSLQGQIAEAQAEYSRVQAALEAARKEARAMHERLRGV